MGTFKNKHVYAIAYTLAFSTVVAVVNGVLLKGNHIILAIPWLIAAFTFHDWAVSTILGMDGFIVRPGLRLLKKTLGLK